jgi:hypothetical protein
MSKLTSKIKYLLNVLSRRVVWFVPKNKTIAILDEGGADYLVPCLGNINYFIIEKRRFIYIKYLLMAIFFDMKLKIKDIRHFYYVRILERLNSVLVITLISNCHSYWRLDKNFIRGKFLTVQNGTHYVNKPSDLPKEFDHLFLGGSPYYSNLACISKYDIDYFSKMDVDVENYYPIGTIHTSEYMASFSKKSKLFDLCILTNSSNARPANIKLWEYLFKYIESHDVSACLALKSRNLEDNFTTHIKGLENFFSSSKVEIMHRTKYSTQNASDISNVTIGAFSTVLRQTFARGNKIYPINFAHSSFFPPYDLLGYPLDPSYEQFQSHLDYLLSVDQQAYSNRYRELMAYLDIFSPKNPPMKKLENIIKELVSSARPHITK